MNPERPNTYAKGPGIAAKAERTQRRYRNQQGWNSQTNLTQYDFKHTIVPSKRVRSPSPFLATPPPITEPPFPSDSTPDNDKPSEDEEQPVTSPLHQPTTHDSNIGCHEAEEADLNPAPDREDWELEEELIGSIPSAQPEI